MPIKRDNIIDQLIQEYILEKQSENMNNISFNDFAKRKIKYNKCELLKSRIEDKPLFILMNLLTDSGDEIPNNKEILLSQEYMHYGLGTMNENEITNIIIVLMDNYEFPKSNESINNNENLNNNIFITNNVNLDIDVVNKNTSQNINKVEVKGNFNDDINNLNLDIDAMNINNNLNKDEIKNNDDNEENININENLIINILKSLFALKFPVI